MIVNQSRLTEILGVSDVTIWEWQKEGLPVVKLGDRGLPNEYDTVAVIKWRIAREVAKLGPQTVKDETAKVALEIMQMERDEKKAILVPVEEIAPTWQSRVLSAAAYMHSRHSRLAGLLDATTGVEGKRQLLKQEDAEFLTRLGVSGAQIQEEVEALLAKVSADEAGAFLRRISGHDHKQNTAGPTGQGVGDVRPAGEGPPLGVG